MEAVSDQNASILGFNVINFLIILLTVTLYAYWRQLQRPMHRLSANIPGLKSLPFIGSALKLIGSPHGEIELKRREFMFKMETFTEIFRKYLADDHGYPVRKGWFGPFLIIAIKDPRDIELVLSSQVHLEKSFQYATLKPWFGNGLLISSGAAWRHQRKLIAPTFHLNVLKTFVNTLNDNARSVCQKMRECDGKTFDCHDFMSACTAETLMGKMSSQLYSYE